MRTEPTAEDKAAAEAIREYIDGRCFIGSSEQRFAFFIAKRMAPERKAAAELREENASLKESLSSMPSLYYACELTVSAVTGLSHERPSNPVHAVIWEQLKDAMDHARAAIARAKENDRLKAELSEARQERLKR